MRSTALVVLLALAGMVALALLLPESDPMPPAAAQSGPVADANLIEFELTAIGAGWLRMRQPGYRNIYVRFAQISGMVLYEPGRGIAELYDHPVVLMSVGPNQYRLDCRDSEQAGQVIQVITEYTTPAE